MNDYIILSSDEINECKKLMNKKGVIWSLGKILQENNSIINEFKIDEEKRNELRNEYMKACNEFNNWWEVLAKKWNLEDNIENLYIDFVTARLMVIEK